MNNEEEKYIMFLEKIEKINLKKIGILNIIIGAYISIICINSDILILKIVSSFLEGLGIIEIGLDFALKANKT